AALEAIVQGGQRSRQEVDGAFRGLAETAYRNARLQQEQANVTQRLTDHLRNFDVLIRGVQASALELQSPENRLRLTTSTFAGELFQPHVGGLSQRLSLLGGPDQASYLGALR